MGIRYHSSSEDESPDTQNSVAERRFIPSEIYGEGFDLDSTVYDDGENWTYLPCPGPFICKYCGRRARHWDELIVAIDGACRGNGTPSAKSALGVYFARHSQWNVAKSLNDPGATSQKAELEACSRALTQALVIKKTAREAGTRDLSTIVIKSDSEYLVKGMTQWILK